MKFRLRRGLQFRVFVSSIFGVSCNAFWLWFGTVNGWFRYVWSGVVVLATTPLTLSCAWLVLGKSAGCFYDWTTYFYQPLQGLSSVLIIRVQSHLVFDVVVVCVALCLGLRIPFVGYVSGGSNVCSVGFWLSCLYVLSFINQSNSEGKKKTD